MRLVHDRYVFHPAALEPEVSAAKYGFEAVAGDGGYMLPAVLGFAQGMGGVVNGAIVVLSRASLELQSDHSNRSWLALLPSGQRERRRGSGARSNLTSTLTTQPGCPGSLLSRSPPGPGVLASSDRRTPRSSRWPALWQAWCRWSGSSSQFFQCSWSSC